jgi:hypothetical protein
MTAGGFVLVGNSRARDLSGRSRNSRPLMMPAPFDQYVMPQNEHLAVSAGIDIRPAWTSEN